MAQWKSGPFDSAWNDQVQSAFRLLRRAADYWILHGVKVREPDQILSRIVQGLSVKLTSSEMQYAQVPTRGLPDRLDYCKVPLHSQIEQLLRTPEKTDAPTIAQKLCGILESAAQSWTVHGAETPPTEEILIRLLSTLFHHGLVRRPPPRNLDE